VGKFCQQQKVTLLFYDPQLPDGAYRDCPHFDPLIEYEGTSSGLFTIGGLAEVLQERAFRSNRVPTSGHRRHLGDSSSQHAVEKRAAFIDSGKGKKGMSSTDAIRGLDEIQIEHVAKMVTRERKQALP
jgi:hypothetical protein